MYEQILFEFEHRCYDHLGSTASLHIYECGVCGKKMSTLARQDSCCGEIIVDPKEGTFVCKGCGKVVDGRMREGSGFLNNQFIKDMPPVKKRHYHSGIHFQTHLKRYLGDTPGEIPSEIYDELRHINVTDRDAYFLVREHLKKRKQSKYYKHIFRLIYELGGHRPKLEGWQKDKIEAHYKVMQAYFYDNSGCFMGQNMYGNMEKYRKSLGKFNRKSMPSIAMLLDFLLKGVSHTPYYRLPYLKDPDLRQRVYDFYRCHIENLQESYKLNARCNN